MQQPAAGAAFAWMRAGVHLLAAVTLCLLVAVLYGRTAGFGYTYFDDVDYVVMARAVQEGITPDSIAWAFSTFSMSNWHPLTWLSFMLDVELFGSAAGPKHIVNVVLHALNGLLLYALAQSMLRRPPVAWFIAAVFLAHPLHVESVAWIAERKDVLSAAFYLAAVLAYLRYARMPSASGYLAVLALFVLALLAKPMAVSLPVVLLLLDWWPLERFAGGFVAGAPRAAARRLLLEKLPLFALALASCVITVVAQSGALVSVDRMPVSYRLMNATISCTLYLRDMLLPNDLAALYPLRPIDVLRDFLPALAVVVALSGCAVACVRRRAWFSMGWCWYLVTLLPVLGIVQVGLQSRADRYMYLPSAGLLLAAGAAFCTASQKWRARACVPLGLWLVFISSMCWVQVGYWGNQYMVFQRVLDVSGPVLEAHVGLSGYFLRNGDVAMASQHADSALRLRPQSALALLAAGNVQMQRRDFAAAESLYRAAVSLAPEDAVVLYNLGLSLELQGRKQEARDYIEQVLRLQPLLVGARETRERLLE